MLYLKYKKEIKVTIFRFNGRANQVKTLFNRSM